MASSLAGRLTAAPPVPRAAGESDRVRVFRVRWGAGEGQPMRPRPLRIVVWLTDAVLELKVPHAKRRVVLRRAQTIEAASADTFSLTNAGVVPVEAIEIELKPAPPAPALPDAVAEDAAHLKVLMDNRRVRVLQLRLAPRERSAPHALGARVTIPLTAGSLAVSTDGGPREERRIDAYDARLEPAGRRTVENLANDSYEEITVETR